MSSQKNQKIRTKEQAIDFLTQLINELEEVKFFLPPKDAYFIGTSQTNLMMMVNSINGSDDFFDNIFKDKSQEDIKEWINKESQKW